MKKIPASIRSLHIDSATYKLNPVTITPTFINFFYGNNGSGKSTIAEALKNSCGITWSNNIASQDCKLYVYNTDYIEANLANYDNLPGVFTFNEENIQIQNQIDELTLQKEKLLEDNRLLLETQNNKNDELTKVTSSFLDTCWSKTQTIRDDLKQTIIGRQKKSAFAKEVLRDYNAVNHNLSQLKNLYNTAYSENAVTFPKFSVIEDTAVLDNIANLNLIEKKIISSSDTPFANFIKAMNSTAWVKQGIAHYHSVSNGKCPFCQQQLPSSFEDDIKACFD